MSTFLPVRVILDRGLLAEIERVADDTGEPGEPIRGRSETIRRLLRKALAARMTRPTEDVPTAGGATEFFGSAPVAAPRPASTRIRHIQTDGSVKVYDRPAGTTDLIPVEPDED
jgi:hypothetical protein